MARLLGTWLKMRSERDLPLQRLDKRNRYHGAQSLKKVRIGVPS